MDKTKFLKEKIKENEIIKTMQKSYDNFLQNSYVQNPIEAKLLSLSSAKKQIKPKDLL